MKLIAYNKRYNMVFIGVGSNVYGMPLSGGAVKKFTDAQVESTTIYSLTIDTIHQKYLIAGYENKSLLCWDIETGELVGSRQMRKKPTAVIATTWQSPESNQSYSVAIVSDKAGEIWAVRLPDLQKVVIVAGHTTSVVTDLAFSLHHHHVISSDRDEKVRISSFPDLETIRGYGLGHTSVVSSVCCVSNG